MSFLHDSTHGAHTSGRVNTSQQQSTVLREETECRELLTASIRVAAEANMIAQQTAQELEVQTDQIHRIHNDAQETANNLAVTNYLLKGMKSWWSSLGQLLTSPPQAKKVEFVERPIPEEKNGVGSGQSRSTVRSDLSQLSQMLDEMKCRAIETGKELKHQNAELQEIRNLSELNEEQVDKQRKKLSNLLN